MKYLFRTPTTTLQLFFGAILMLVVASLAASQNYLYVVNISIIFLLLVLLALIINLLLARGQRVLRIVIGLCIVLFFVFHIYMWLDFLKNID